MRAVSTVAVILVLVGVAFSWGSDGHQIVGQVGQAFLTSTTLSAVNRMLNGNTLAEISTWPDNYDHTSQGSWSEHLHYVDIPDNARNFNYEYCASPNSDPPGCVVTAVTNNTDRLVNNLQNNYWESCSESSDSTPPCDLSYLVHWLGDIHQPMHVAFASDEGGNQYDVDFNGQCTNLHSLWDSGLLTQYENDNKYSWQDIAQELITWLQDNQDVMNYVNGFEIPGEWGNETFTLARNIPYNFSPGDVPANSNWVLNFNFTIPLLPSRNRQQRCGSGYVVIGNSYYQRTIPVVLSQLAKGGARLANHLNLIYDPSYNSTHTAF